MLSDASAADNFGKHCDKKRNCSKLLISPFVTTLSTFYGDYKPSFISRVFMLFPEMFLKSSVADLLMWVRVKRLIGYL